MADLQQLEDSIVGLSLLDAAQLVKKLEERLGVSAAAAAPVMVAGGGAAAGAAPAEEKTEFTVVLTGAWMSASWPGVGRSWPSHWTTPKVAPAAPDTATTTSAKNSFQGKRRAAVKAWVVLQGRSAGAVPGGPGGKRVRSANAGGLLSISRAWEARGA